MGGADEPGEEGGEEDGEEAQKSGGRRSSPKLPPVTDVLRAHAAPVPAVFAARERVGASDSDHQQTLELPAAPQVRTEQTVQVFGDSTLQF